MREEAERRIGHLYPKVAVTDEMVAERADLKPYAGRQLTVIAWLWARTVKSPDPAFSGVDVPLMSTFMLSTKKGKEAYIEPAIDGGDYHFTIKAGSPPEAAHAKAGTGAGKRQAFRCLMSRVPITYDSIRREGRSGRIGVRLMAVIAEGDRGRVYLSPTAEHEAITRDALPEWKPEVSINHWPGRTNVVEYGLTTFGDLFTPRQLVALNTFSDLVTEARDRIRLDSVAAGFPDDDQSLHTGGTGATAYAEAAVVYLAFAVSKAADRNTTLCVWEQKMDRLRGTFGRQALPMTWDYAETNPFSGAGGDIYGTTHSLCEVLDKFAPVLRVRASRPTQPAPVPHTVRSFRPIHPIMTTLVTLTFRTSSMYG